MPSFKMLKLPKKPKSNAATSVLERWTAKVKQIKKTNQERFNTNKKMLTAKANEVKKRDALKKEIAGINGTYVIPNRFSVISKSKPKAKAKGKAKAKAKGKRKIAGKRKR